LSADATPGPPRRVALTGGIATGKSYCLARFAELGAPTIDADVLARQAVAPGTAGFEAVRARFGSAIVNASGELDRAALGRIVFADHDARLALEAIVHPVVYAAIQRWFSSLAHGRQPRAAVADIPLLYETGHEGDFDVVVVAACGDAEQRARLIARSGLTPDEADRRLQAQMPVAAKAARADYVIDTSGTHEQTTEQVRRIWTEITAGGTAPPPAYS
jgi:dephospho-CoA kinase